MSSPLAVRRGAPREAIVSENEYNDDYGSDASSSKRRRVGHANDTSLSSSPEPALQHEERSRAQISAAARTNRPPSLPNEHQPGAIVRVAVTNFVTYESAVFYPGPNLNMVIGPNGTGKSSLVCAICLGLGYSPRHLGRAQQIGEFVKYGSSFATIEIELKGRPNERRNHVVKVRIIKDGDKRKWWLNDSDTSLKSVQSLMTSFGIQVDNLCQFLPQDRVAEFAGLSPVELLHETQRAAAPEEMLSWHDELKALRADEKLLQLQHTTDQATMTNLEQRQEGLRADVERLQERASIQEKVLLLEKTVPFVEYRLARQEHAEQKDKLRESQRKLLSLEREVEPTMQAVNKKQQYQAMVKAVVEERKKVVQTCESVADRAMSSVEASIDKLKEIDQTQKAELDSDKIRKQEITSIQRKIRDLAAQQQNAPPEFDPANWNSQIRVKEHEYRDLEGQLRDLKSQNEELRRHLPVRTGELTRIKEDIRGLESQAGKLSNKLKNLSPDTATAWAWVQQNQHKFEKEVLGPALVTCAVKDPRYTDQIEAALGRQDCLAFTIQTSQDRKMLADHLWDVLKLGDVHLKTQTKPLRHYQRPVMSKEQMSALGFDAWALDMLEGPEVVLAMLCNEDRLHKTPVAVNDISDEQFRSLIQSGIQSAVTGRQSYRIQNRQEYGSEAVSTTTKNVYPARLFTDQPIDSGRKRELEERRREIEERLETMSSQQKELQTKIEALQTEGRSLRLEIEETKTKKADAQRVAGQFAALPNKISREKENLDQRYAQGEERRERLLQLSLQKDHETIRKVEEALSYKEAVAALKLAHENLLEGEIRLLEATSDVDALMQRNSGIAQQLEDERRLVNGLEGEVTNLRQVAQRALAVCKTILEEEKDGGYFTTLDSNLTLEALQHDIDAEKSKLEFLHEGNAGALKEFESRQATIERLSSKISDTDRKLGVMSRNIAAIREKWEPELDKLIAEISEAFSHNFEQISCAGEVGVHKDEDFDNWSIEIKVKFRENEDLQLLDQHRQSGGERAVSTIFYLMSLQSLARAPFRVVDEINQGMDPRNERMVHGRMVEIACQEHTSQYFLITPKLLTGLKYDARMKVLLINSGEHMPEDHRKFTISKAIAARRAVATAS